MQSLGEEFVTGGDALADPDNVFGHVYHIVVMVAGPGVINTVVFPWTYLLWDRRINIGLKKWLRSWRN